MKKWYEKKAFLKKSNIISSRSKYNAFVCVLFVSRLSLFESILVSFIFTHSKTKKNSFKFFISQSIYLTILLPLFSIPFLPFLVLPIIFFFLFHPSNTFLSSFISQNTHIPIPTSLSCDFKNRCIHIHIQIYIYIHIYIRIHILIH